MAGICTGRAVIVTGAGRGIGAEHAVEFARQGAQVVVNDLDDVTPVLDRIRAEGGEAIASNHDITDWDAAAALVAATVDAFGRLDTLVNNAGAVRDRMFVNMSVDEWDAAIRINLRGHFCPTRHAAAYWRDRAKAGDPVDASSTPVPAPG
jgi:NAD(P)-dependent dehydrogenase (short-subunit alcohol dehydrogenase family)